MTQWRKGVRIIEAAGRHIDVSHILVCRYVSDVPQRPQKLRVAGGDELNSIARPVVKARSCQLTVIYGTIAAAVAIKAVRGRDSTTSFPLDKPMRTRCFSVLGLLSARTGLALKGMQ